MEDIEKEALLYCKQNEGIRNRRVKNFDIETFKIIAGLYREKSPISDATWDRYILLAKKSRDIQVAIVRHPEANKDVIDKLFKSATIYSDVYGYLFFSSKELSDSVAFDTYDKINIERAMKIADEQKITNMNTQCANTIIKDLLTSCKMNTDQPLYDFQINAFYAMDNSTFAKEAIESDNVDEGVLTAICGNDSLSDEVREAAYNKGVNYCELKSISRPIVNDLYDKSIYTLFGNELKDIVSPGVLYSTENNHIHLLASLIRNNLLNGGQIKNVLLLCGGYDEQYNEIFRSMVSSIKDEEVLRDLYKLTRTIPKKSKQSLDRYFLSNENLPSDICLKYTKEICSSLFGSTPEYIPFENMIQFRRMASSCKFTKEIEKILMSCDASSVYGVVEVNAEYVLCGFLENKGVTSNVIEHLSHCNIPEVNISARTVKEMHENEKFRDFYFRFYDFFNFRQHTDDITLLVKSVDEFGDCVERIYADYISKGISPVCMNLELRRINDILMTFHIKKPTRAFEIDTKEDIKYYVNSGVDQCDFYIKLNGCMELLNHINNNNFKNRVYEYERENGAEL